MAGGSSWSIPGSHWLAVTSLKYIKFRKPLCNQATKVEMDGCAWMVSSFG